MALLLYSAVRRLDAPGLLGIGGSPLQSRSWNDVTIVFSDIESNDPHLRSALRESAVVFHHILQQLFRDQTIIPFRFPTLMATSIELDRYMAERATGFDQELRRLSKLVQVEVQLSGPATAHGTSRPESGTEYLRLKQSRSAEVLKAASDAAAIAGALATDTKILASATGNKLCLLVARHDVPGLRAQYAQAGTPLTGPWPPSAFISEALRPEEVKHG
jgi:hypothetical protein